MFKDIKYVLLDIEGTTTSISFVKDVLFPIARNCLPNYLKKHWNEPHLKEDIELLRKQAIEDVSNNLEGVTLIPDQEATADDIIESVIKNVYQQMDIDRKVQALKQLQGHIWLDAYKEGTIKGHLYNDVLPALKKWNQQGLQCYIYSSGSVAAQKLLFAHSVDGNLLSYFQGYFDTKVGLKTESKSYVNISKQLETRPETILFFTDVSKESIAAKEAGLQVCLVVREGNVPLSIEDQPRIDSFDELEL